MKIRTRKILVLKMLNWYTEQLTEKFLNQKITLGVLVGMQHVLDNLKQQKHLLEPMNELWTFPVLVRATSPGTFVVEIVPEFETNELLYIDWP